MKRRNFIQAAIAGVAGFFGLKTAQAESGIEITYDPNANPVKIGNVKYGGGFSVQQGKQRSVGVIESMRYEGGQLIAVSKTIVFDGEGRYFTESLPHEKVIFETVCTDVRYGKNPHQSTPSHTFPHS